MIITKEVIRSLNVFLTQNNDRITNKIYDIISALIDQLAPFQLKPINKGVEFNKNNCEKKLGIVFWLKGASPKGKNDFKGNFINSNASIKNNV